MALLFFILACYGITLIVVQSKIMEPVREFFKNKVPFFYKLIHCMMCFGFWVGAILSFCFNYSPSYLLLNGSSYILPYNILDGAFISGCIWLIYLLQLNLERHVEDKL